MLRKRTNLRLILLFIICLMVLSASCQDNNLPSGNDGKYKKTAYPDVLKITRCLYFGDSADNQELKEEFLKVFHEKTGIKLEVFYPPRTNYMEKVNLMIASGELNGIVNFFSPSNIIKAVNDNTIEPLDDYLKDNENWNSMPEEYRNLYIVNGKIYGISAGYEGSFFTRSFRKDWLDNLGMKVPETADELLEVARAFTVDDPDGNGIDDTYGLTSSKFWNLQDIFQAFGVKLGNTGENPITWDPATGLWQDSMLKPEMADALAYIKKLYDSGYLDASFLTNQGNNMRENLWTGKAGSTFYWVTHACRQAVAEMKNTIPEAKWVEIPALKGKRTQQLNNRVMGGLIYVLVKGTNQPRETVNTFIDMLFDKDIFLLLKHGIEGKTFRQEDNTVIVMINPETGKPYETSGLTNEMPQFNRFNFPWCYDGTREEIQASLDVIKLEEQLLKEGLDKNLIFDIYKAAYDSPLSNEFSKKSTDMEKIFERETSMAILGEKTIDRALEDYRLAMKELGADLMLREANEAIGKTGWQTY